MNNQLDDFLEKDEEVVDDKDVHTCSSCYYWVLQQPIFKVQT